MPAATAVACALALAPMAHANAGPRIVNGTPASISDVPYQVALYDPHWTPDVSHFCGGVVKDATHVLTAAHCVVDSGTVISSPRTVSVFAGSVDLTDTGAGVKTVPANSLSIDPAYNPDTGDHDIAQIELATPLYSSPTSAIAPIDPISDTDMDTALAGAVTGTVSGWGCTDAMPAGSVTCDTSLPNLLLSAQVPLVPQNECVTDYGPNITNNMFCAGEASPTVSNNHDACFGDSGGPLTVDSPSTPGTPVLAGLVNAGAGCAQPGFPGIYARVSKLGTFIEAADPTNTAAPAVVGSAVVGQSVTCDPGAWTGALGFHYRFMRDAGGTITPLTELSNAATYVVDSRAENAKVFCEVQTNGTDAIRAVDSAEVAVPAVQSPAQAPPPPPSPLVDSTPPSLRVVSKRCTKTRCTVKVRVTDAAPSSGIGGVKAVMRWSKKVRCKSRGSARARTCRKRMRKTLKPKAGTGGLFTIVATRLTPGTGYTLTLTPFDRAGNKPDFSTITNVRTKPRHRSGLLH